MAQFGLSSILLITALVGIVFACYQTSNSIDELSRNRIPRLEVDAARVVVDDKEMYGYVSCPAIKDTEYKWRVFLPAGKEYELVCEPIEFGEGDSLTGTKIKVISRSRFDIPSGYHELLLLAHDPPIFDEAAEDEAALKFHLNGELALSVPRPDKRIVRDSSSSRPWPSDFYRNHVGKLTRTYQISTDGKLGLWNLVEDPKRWKYDSRTGARFALLRIFIQVKGATESPE